MSVFIMPQGTKASDLVMLLQACHRRIDTLTAERDRLAEALRLIEQGSDEPDATDESRWMQYIAHAALAELEKKP